MDSTIIVCIISNAVTLAGLIIGFISNRSKTEQLLATKMEVMEVKITGLTDEVRKHNNFAQRVPVIEEQIKVINHRIQDLEKGA